MPYYNHPHHHPHLGPVDWHEFDPHPYGDPYLIGGRRYVDPDFVASESDDQLPSISTIGRGPRGEGLYVGSTVNQDGTVSFTLNSTLTGEVVWESPNLAPAEISFNTVDWRDLVPGVPAPLNINVKQGGITKMTTAYLPAGQVGSLIFLLGETLTKTADDTYSVTIADLIAYGRHEYHNKPIPRPNDIVMFHYQDDDEHGLAIGIVEAVGGTTRETYHGGDIPTPTNVVFTARTFIPANWINNA